METETRLPTAKESRPIATAAMEVGDDSIGGSGAVNLETPSIESLVIAPGVELKTSTVPDGSPVGGVLGNFMITVISENVHDADGGSRRTTLR